MVIQRYIKKKGLIWKILPYPYKTAQAIYPYVFVPDFLYNNLLSKKPNIRWQALIKHEEVHLKRQKRFGPTKFFVVYLLSRRFRYKEELLAYREEQKFLKKHKSSLDLDNVAKNLSGSMYLWCVSYNKARDELGN